MKEATGEANITVITIVLIAIVLTVGTAIVTNVLKSTKFSSCCSSIGGAMYTGKCCVDPTYDSNTGKVSGCGTKYARNNYSSHASLAACMDGN